MNQSVVDLLNSDLPPRQRTQLSLVIANRAEMQAWLSNLSMLNVGETARQLFTTLRELADLDTDETLRMELCEVLRPALHTINASLSKHYINQNILLDERSALPNLANNCVPILPIFIVLLHYALLINYVLKILASLGLAKNGHNCKPLVMPFIAVLLN